MKGTPMSPRPTSAAILYPRGAQTKSNRVGICVFSAAIATSSISYAGDGSVWSLFCASHIKLATDCVLTQSARDPISKVSGSVALYYSAPEELSLRIRTSQIYGADKRISIVVDGDQMGVVDATCGDDFCESTSALSQSQYQALSSAKRFDIHIKTSDKEGAIVPFNTGRFAESVSSLRRKVFVTNGSLDLPAVSAANSPSIASIPGR